MTPTETEHLEMLEDFAGSSVRVCFGAGALRHLGRLAGELGGSRVLLVSDGGIRRAGHVDRAVELLTERRLCVRIFDRVTPNPTSATVEAGCAMAREFEPDLIVGLGGGSSMDTAKGINFLYTNGGRMADYRGTNKAARPMLAMIAAPTTAGTGSEAQSYALISDPRTHEKMACGDRKALARVAILDPQLAATQPRSVAAATGIDAVAHAVETAACTRRNAISREFSRRAWALLDGAFERSLANPGDLESAGDMLLGAHLAGCAIENSMLGAAHAAANPLTAKFGITHGVAVGAMLPHVIRFNAQVGGNPYADLMEEAEELARRIESMLDAAGQPRGIAPLGVPGEAIGELAAMAATQWTGTFNARPVGEAEFRVLYAMALAAD